MRSIGKKSIARVIAYICANDLSAKFQDILKAGRSAFGVDVARANLLIATPVFSIACARGEQ